MAGTPDSVFHVLKAGSHLEDMDINQIVARARVVLAEENIGAKAASSDNQQHRVVLISASVLCRACNQPNHYARACLERRSWRRGERGNMRCYGYG